MHKLTSTKLWITSAVVLLSSYHLYSEQITSDNWVAVIIGVVIGYQGTNVASKFAGRPE